MNDSQYLVGVLKRMSDSADLKSAAAAVAAQFSILSGKLKRAVVALESGELPVELTGEEIGEVRTAFSALRTNAIEEARFYHLITIADADPLKTLPEIETAVATLVEAREKKEQADRGRMKLCVPLEMVREIRHRDSDDFSPLVSAQQQAIGLRTRIAQATWPNTDMETLTRECQPFNALLSLVQSPNEYDDTEWDTMQEAVENAFGRSLSVACVRGKLMFGGTPHPATNGAKPATATPPASRSERKSVTPDILPYLSTR